jgi:hypothetical protein
MIRPVAAATTRAHGLAPAPFVVARRNPADLNSDEMAWKPDPRRVDVIEQRNGTQIEPTTFVRSKGDGDSTHTRQYVNALLNRARN